MPRSSSPKSASFLLRMDDATKRRLYTKSEIAGVPLSEALRAGGEEYLDGVIAQHESHERGEVGGDDSEDLLTEFRAVAARVERRITGR